MSGVPSIRRQITWRLAALFALALLLSSGIFLYESWIHRIDNLDRGLREAAERVAAAVEPTPAGGLRLRGAALAGLQIAEIPALRYAAIDGRTGAVAEGSTPGLDAEIAAALASLPRAGGFDFRGPGGVSERGFLLLPSEPGSALRVVVSSPNLSLADTIAWMQDEALSELLPILAPLFVGALLIAPVTIRRSLRPLDRLSAQAALIEPARTDVRLKEAGIPSEILPLVQKVNEALARIDEGFEQQRRFTTNAAHELRTPLAVLRARIDGLEEGPAKAGFIGDVERMSRLVSQLLLAGRLELQGAPPETTVDLGEIARDTVERLRPLHAARGRDLRLGLPAAPVRIRGDSESLGDALRNLIDNALAYSPAEQPVEVVVSDEGWVEVRDRGAGVAPADREQIFERFWRGRRSAGEGAGLGLSIVKAIVDRHRGRITVGEAPGGGAVFRMTFPPAPEDRSRSRGQA